ncbi:hypothetical protein ABZY58_11845 [Micromonospora tulbaghiae]|uniref:hypothetical protein n=1 Tax=Micromonospora tulbaghiae TaxID=479978 RepID=UPI0033B31EFD
MLADEPLVGESLTRKVRIVLVAVMVAFLLTNITSYLLGQAFSADARERATAETSQRVAELERQFNEDLAARKQARDRESAAQNAQVQQLRRDLCLALDRVQPRDREVLDARRRYGCTATPTQAPAAAGATQRGGGTSSGGVSGGGAAGSGTGPASGGGRGPAGPAGPTGPAGPPAPTPPPPASPSQPPAAEPDGGLICLPLLGCIL